MQNSVRGTFCTLRLKLKAHSFETECAPQTPRILQVSVKKLQNNTTTLLTKERAADVVRAIRSPAVPLRGGGRHAGASTTAPTHVRGVRRRKHEEGLVVGHAPDPVDRVVGDLLGEYVCKK